MSADQIKPRPGESARIGEIAEAVGGFKFKPPGKEWAPGVEAPPAEGDPVNLSLADRFQAYLADPWPAFANYSRGERDTMAPGFAFLRRTLRSARRFTLTKEFVAEAFYHASVNPEVVLARADLARLPFPAVWIEWDQEYRVRTQMAAGTSAPTNDNEDRGLGGYLLYPGGEDGGGVVEWYATGFVANRDSKDGLLYPAAQALTRPRPGADPMVFLHGDDPDDDSVGRMLVTLGWGYHSGAGYEAALPAMVERGNTLPEPNTIMRLLNRAGDTKITLDDRGNRIFKAYETCAIESRGDLRWLITVLALINCAPIRYRHVAPSGRFMRRRNSIAYLDSHVCTIHGIREHVVNVLDRDAAKAAAQRAPQTPRRAHEVRGHWCLAEYKHGGRACRHIPAPGLTEDNHSICAKCEKLIVWRPFHTRGDASRGFVKKEYEVAR